MIRRLVGPLVAIAAFLGTLEITVRVADPQPRVQAVAAYRLNPTGDDGVLTWRDVTTRTRERGNCAPDDRGVLVTGSSIFFGSSLHAKDVFTTHLGPRLADTAARGCVRNVAQPGYSAEQKWSVARPLVDAHRPFVVVWEVWVNDPGHFVLVGDRAYNVGQLRLDRLGTPAAFPFPAVPHAWLFRHSHAWRYLHIALSGPDDAAIEAAWDRYLHETLPAIRRHVEAAGGQLLVVVMPPLDRSFEATLAAHRAPDSRYAGLLAGEGGFDVLDAASFFLGRDPAEMGIDTCCHLSVEGHRVLADALEPHLRRLLPAGPADGEAP